MRWPRRAPASDRTDTATPSAGGGAFGRLGDLVVRRPWLVIGLWLLLAIALPPAFPPLTVVTQEHPVAPLPADAPSIVATQQMTAAFHQAGQENVLLVLLSNDKGLGPADEKTYRTLVDNLRSDSQDVVMLQDFVATPPLRETLTSKDGKAWLLPIGLAGELASADSYPTFLRVSDIVKNTVSGSDLVVHLTGPAATVADSIVVSLQDQVKIEVAIITLLLVILLVIYRKPTTILLPLIVIGFSLSVAQAVIAGAAQLGLTVSQQTIILLSGMMAGAGTDYAVFLISRYHDFLRKGADSDQAVKSALSSIGKVIAASAGTVGITFLGMHFAQLPLFATIGPALAIAIGVALLAALTLLPAILVLAGRRGWASPRRELTTRFWRRSGIRIVRRPVTNLLASLLVLVGLAACLSVVRYNYDDRKALPPSVQSSIGWNVMDRYFPVNSTIPQYLFIQSPHDLRTPEALADMEQLAQRVSQLPDIAAVRGITRPTGAPLEVASTTYQAGEIGKRLNDATTLISDHDAELNRLASGAEQLAVSLATLRDQMTASMARFKTISDQVTKAMADLNGLITTLTAFQQQFGPGTTLNQVGQGDHLVNGIRTLGDTLQMTFGDMASNFEWIDPVVTALDGSPYCDTTPVCGSARDQFHKMQTPRADGTLQKLSDLAGQLRSTGPLSNLSQTLTGLTKSMNGAKDAMGLLGGGGLGGGASGLGGLGVPGGLAAMQQGFDALANGSRQVADGVRTLVDQTKRMGADLGLASQFLLSMKNDATVPSMSGFYIPPQVLGSDDFKKAAAFFMSADGHAARYLIQTKLNPFSTAAMDQVNSVTDTARQAQPNTTLSDASIAMTGYPASLRDARDYYNHDIRFIIALTVIVVLLILIALLRAIVAPIYLIGSVILSYLAALGLGVIVFQFLLKQELHWSVPGLTFIILVAMGADYNMLLISRIRDESPRGIRSGVIRTVGSTGGVITAAGLIFAASMFGLLFASIGTIVQAGFVVGAGILLDTFLVRTVTVPAMAVLVGRANWWPSKAGSRT